MQTHPDDDLRPNRALCEGFYEKTEAHKNLERRAEALRNEITAGAPGEREIQHGEKYGIHIVQRPDDPDCLRVSLGEVRDQFRGRYLVFRGNPDEVADLLARASRAIADCNMEIK